MPCAVGRRKCARLRLRLPIIFEGCAMGENQALEIQNTDSGGSVSYPDSAPFEPIWFMLGFIAGLLFISLFKGRWFL